MTTTRAPFLSTKYSAYHHSQVPKEDDELTRIGPGTPCGEYLRRFWQPVCYADDLADVPVALKILGEELVAFRDFTAVSDWSRLTAPIAARRWSSGWFPSAESAAAITAGSSMSTAPFLKLPVSPSAAPSRTGSATAHTRSTGSRESSLPTWAPRKTFQPFPSLTPSSARDIA